MLTTAPRPLDFFPAAKVENFELEYPMIGTLKGKGQFVNAKY